MSSAPSRRPRTASPARGLPGRIRARLRFAPVGRVFTPSEFLGLGSRAAIDQALARLTRRGELRRVGRGLYERPRVHPLLGTLRPSVEAIVRALADAGHLRVQPAGAYAANVLGLTEQVPLKPVFLTDGASRVVRVGEQQILLRHATPRALATAGRTSGLVIQALRHLGRKHVDESVRDTLRRRLTRKERLGLARDARFAPEWIAVILRALGAEHA